ncbi:small ribosomal subunit protein uS3m-like [Halichondria panicea]|uniref:small ribosomal subunit protein uS3m-like n=1 Tax=Halichondria panicea TaxID=6063 RepID=UPI00312BA0E8
MALCRKACPLLARGYHTTTAALKAGYFKITPKGDFPLTYEQAHPPYRIGVTKGWTSWNATTLHGPARGPMSVAIEDKFIRKFITGTWYKMWLSEVVIKRVHNNVTVCGMVCPLPSIKTMHFLLGYSETLLSHLLKCNVRLEIQCVQSKKNLVYKFV